MKIFFIGSNGLLSRQPLQALLASHHELCGVGLDSQRASEVVTSPSLAVHDADSIEAIVQSVDCPLVDMRQPAEEIIAQLDPVQADIILVSCYPR